MADIKITALPASAGAAASDVFVVDTGAATQKITKTLLFTAPVLSGNVTMDGQAIFRSGAAGGLYLAGGSAYTSGGYILLLGESHATDPDEVHVHGDTTFYDSSANVDRGIHVEAVTAVSSFGSGWSGTNVAYYRDPMGRIWLRGNVYTSAGTANDLFTLPAGYLPATDQLLLCGMSAAGGHGILTVNSSTGVVGVSAAVSAGVYMYLDGISFRAA